ncbi:hypothetical protein [Sporosarcina sp. HYO08]|nr:hypothetical protein [Sporosarcina sp. HYO08]
MAVISIGQFSLQQVLEKAKESRVQSVIVPGHPEDDLIQER